MPLLIVSSVVQPIIVQLHTQNKLQELERVLRVCSTFMSVPAILSLLGFILYGTEIMGIVYGEFYRQGAIILKVLSIGFLFRVLAGASEMTLMMTYEKKLMKISIMTGAIMVIGSIIGAKYFNAFGLSVAVCFSMLVRNLWNVLVIRKALGLWTHPTLRFEEIVNFIKPDEMQRRFHLSQENRGK
jgi:O-antigen/teichoic acid export membrane protein